MRNNQNLGIKAAALLPLSIALAAGSITLSILVVDEQGLGFWSLASFAIPGLFVPVALRQVVRTVQLARDWGATPQAETGHVTRHEDTAYDDRGNDVATFCFITVVGRKYSVSREIYEWLQDGDEVEVVFRPHSKTLVEVHKLAG